MRTDPEFAAVVLHPRPPSRVKVADGQPEVGGAVEHLHGQFADHADAFGLLPGAVDFVDLAVHRRVREAGRVPSLPGLEALAQGGGGIDVAAAHQVAGTVVQGGHQRQKGGVLHGLNEQPHPHLGQVVLQERHEVHVGGTAGADLDLHCEAVRVARLGEQLAGLGRVVAEQLLHRGGHFLQRLVVGAVVGMLGIGHQLGVAAVELLNDLPLVHGQVQGAPHPHVVERLAVHAQGHELTRGGQPAAPLQLRRRLLQVVHGNPPSHLQDVQLAGAQRRQPGRLVLDDAVGHVIDERNGVVLGANALPIPVVGVLDVALGVAAHVSGELERAGAGDVAPVPAIDGAKLPGNDGGVVAVAEAVGPLRIELAEVEHHRVVAARLQALDVVKVRGDAARTGA